MPNDVEKTLLERLQALRGLDPAATPPDQSASSVDPVERRKPVTTEDSLAARLKSLRDQDRSPRHERPRRGKRTTRTPPPEPAHERDDDADAVLQTDMHTLEEMLAHVGVDDDDGQPTAEHVASLLADIARSVAPNSDGEHADDLIARFRDELEIDTALPRDADNSEELEGQIGADVPSLPQDLDELLHRVPSAAAGGSPGPDLDDITARLALLRAPSASFQLPSVPSSAPSAASASRLASRTGYTDEDADGWCTVCLEDATLQCPACDDDVYCTRCWREMHVGPAAAFDDRSHKAVHLTRVKKQQQQQITMGA